MSPIDRLAGAFGVEWPETSIFFLGSGDVALEILKGLFGFVDRCCLVSFTRSTGIKLFPGVGVVDTPEWSEGDDALVSVNDGLLLWRWNPDSLSGVFDVNSLSNADVKNASIVDDGVVGVL